MQFITFLSIFISCEVIQLFSAIKSCIFVYTRSRNRVHFLCCDLNVRANGRGCNC